MSEAAARGNQHSSASTWCKRAELFRRCPGLQVAARRIQTMNGRFEGVDPIERPLDRMPTRNLPEDILSMRDAGDLQHPVSAHRSYASRVKNSARRFFCNLPVTVRGNSASRTNFIRRGIL